MAGNKTIADYGAPADGYENGEAVESASDEMDAAYFNALIDDSASMTRTSKRIYFQFTTTTTAAPVDLTPDANWAIDTQWGTARGSSSTLYPTVAEKLAAGQYRFVWEQTFQNEINDSETLSVTFGGGNVNSSTVFTKVQVAVSGNEAIVSILDDSHALAEPANGTKIQIELR